MEKLFKLTNKINILTYSFITAFILIGLFIWKKEIQLTLNLDFLGVFYDFLIKLGFVSILVLLPMFFYLASIIKPLKKKRVKLLLDNAHGIKKIEKEIKDIEKESLNEINRLKMVIFNCDLIKLTRFNKIEEYRTYEDLDYLTYLATLGGFMGTIFGIISALSYLTDLKELIQNLGHLNAGISAALYSTAIGMIISAI